MIIRTPLTALVYKTCSGVTLGFVLPFETMSVYAREGCFASNVKAGGVKERQAVTALGSASWELHALHLNALTAIGDVECSDPFEYFANMPIEIGSK